MQMELEENERDANAEPNDRIRKQKFAPQQIRGNQIKKAGDRESPQKPAPPRNDYVFERQSYQVQNVQPKDDFLDSRLISDLAEVSIPFPMRKICESEEQGGAWYVFGTKCILIREYDQDLLMVREYKSHGDEHFNSYMAN